MSNYKIRLIEPRDAAAVLAIYAPYVAHTNISFEYEVPSLADFEQRIATVTNDYPWLVCEQEDGNICGYAYAGLHRSRTAYMWSVEAAIYMAEDFRGKGIGKRLYLKLFELLKLQGYATVFAGMTLPNDKSEALHRSCGFEEIGVFRNIGYKNNQWHDVKWMQLSLAKYENDMELPKPLTEVNYKSILQ